MIVCGVTENVLAVLARHHLDAVVIGAVALAAHHCVRQTEDLDLGVNADVPTLRAVLRSLSEAGPEAELREPDGEDPLGGVIDVSGGFGLVQIISFAGRFPAVIDDAVRLSTLVVREDSRLKIVPIPHLIALKLYAGGHKSKADIIELLTPNPKAGGCPDLTDTGLGRGADSAPITFATACQRNPGRIPNPPG